MAEPMAESHQRRRANWPRVTPPGQSKVWDIFSVVLAIVGLVVGLIALSLGAGLTLLIVIALFGLSLLIRWLLWGLPLVWAYGAEARRRVREYPVVANAAARSAVDLAQMQSRHDQVVADLVQMQSRHEALMAIFLAATPYLRAMQLQVVNVVKRQGVFLLVIERKRTPQLGVGTRLTIFHAATEELLGEFESTTCQSTRYLAREIKVYDPVWWGHWHGIAEARLSVQPGHDVVAFPIEPTETDEAEP